MKLFRWVQGRQRGTKYRKFTLWYFKLLGFGFDAYILKYEPNTHLQEHTDPVENGEHWRVNIPVIGNSKLYIRLKENSFASNAWKISKGPVLFRPDIQSHFLIVGDKGCTKLSFGFVKFKK